MYATGCWLSAAFALGMLRAIDALLPAEVPRGRRRLVLLVAAFWPGFVYDHAIFPVSLATLLLAVAVRLTAGGRWTAGGLAGAGAALSYTSGYTIGPVMGAWAVLGGTGVGVRGRAANAGRRAVAMVGPALLPVAAFAGVLVWQRAVIGRWTALFEVHGQFHHAGPHPLNELGHLLWLGSWVDRPLGRAMWQVPAVTAVWAAAVGPVAVGWRGSVGRRPAAGRGGHGLLVGRVVGGDGAEPVAGDGRDGGVPAAPVPAVAGPGPGGGGGRLRRAGVGDVRVLLRRVGRLTRPGPPLGERAVRA